MRYDRPAAAMLADVTTEDVPDSQLYGVGVRVAIGGSSYDWYGSTCAGIAFVDSFGRSDSYYWPAFIFVKVCGARSTAAVQQQCHWNVCSLGHPGGSGHA